MAENSVLIIDDDIWMQRILSKTLQSYGFEKTYLTSNGFDGIALAVEHIPTLIVLDILMPELSGHLTLKILKHIKRTRDIPVLMVSALSDVENLGLAVKSGTAGFISKPFTRATVYEKLVNIYGKETLDQIAKGQPVAPVSDYYKKEIMNKKADSDESILPNIDIDKPENKKDASASGAKPKVTQDQLLQHYQDEEKKSIDSIKKLLMKTRKS